MFEKILDQLLEIFVRPGSHKYFGYYELIRRTMIRFIGRVLSRILQTLPKKLSAEVKSTLFLTTTMPYKTRIHFTVNSRRDLSRSRFTGHEPEIVDWIEELLKNPGICMTWKQM